MRTWHINSGNPSNFSIAADARFCSPDYANDHIWELNIGQGEPPALSLQTTYGLRARHMRLFPRFVHKEIQLSDPQQFHRPPVVQVFYPNYLLLVCSPFPGLDVQIEYWAPGSQIVSGRLSITNTSVLTDHLRLEWVSLLNPMAGGQSMAVETMNGATVLQGSTGDLSPVCCITGGPDGGSGPYPALVFDLELFPGNVRQFTWAMAALGTPQDSYNLAQRTLQRAWDAELTRLELHNEGQWIDIQTGEPEWDLAFALSQKMAYGTFFPGGKHLPYPSFVLSRQPDHGYSIRGDGTDYSYLWSGQTPFDAWYLASILLPGSADFFKGVIYNFLETQFDNGFIDLKPGLGGQRSRRLAQPVLASLAYQVSLHGQDFAWLEDLYPALLRFVQAWFSPEHDRDHDGFPEWDHPLQTGLEDAPIYDRYQTGSQGASISVIESPALAAFLYRECTSLLKIARRIDSQEGVEWLQAQLASLKTATAACWDAKAHTYRYRDFETHKRWPALQLLSFDRSGTFPLKTSLKGSRRLQIRIAGNPDVTRPINILLHGNGPKGKVVEHILPNRFFWQDGVALVTTHNVFKSVKFIEVNGLVEGDTGSIFSVDFTQEDLSLLLPLWAEIPDVKQARLLIEKTLLKRYLKPFGLSITPSVNGDSVTDDNDCCGPDTVLLPWNQLLTEGLLAYGYRPAAATIFTRLMSAILPVLRETGAFRAAYSGSNGMPRGEWNTVSALAPLGLFLKIVGIRQIGKNEVILDGINPFPWPVTVKYQGMTITCHAQDVVVSFSTGHTITVDGSGPHRVSLAFIEEAKNSDIGEQTNE
jgi:hypothetical protein